MFRSLSAKVILCGLAMLALGGLGGVVTSGSIKDWYTTLNHPVGKPPNWVFGPVWSVLYLMIGTSFALIWHHHPKQLGKTKLSFYFGTQLILNLAWSPVFFGAHQIEIALVIIVLMWIAILLSIREFNKFSKPAAYLLIPYLCWVSYASYLNAGYAVLN